MFILPAAIGSFLLVNVLCACIALGIGFAAGVWFFGAKPAPPERRKTPAAEPNDEARRAAERAAMATSRVADVAKNVASDVGDHAAKMKAISANLAGIDREDIGANGAVFAALDQMLTANTELQDRLEKAEKQLEEQAAEIRAHESDARTDSLTGIANRRAFDDELKRRFSEWDRKHAPCSLVLLDIDFFKKFNDTHGHQVGDEVLRQVAKVLKAQCRDMDLPCRYGGEEFGVVLPATDAAGAATVAERIRAAVEESTTVCGDKKLKVTCSIGLAHFTSLDDVDRIIRRADEALYASKKAGRNCGHWNDGKNCLPLGEAVAEPDNAAEEIIPSDKPDELAESVRSNGRETAPGTFVQMLKRRVTECHRFGIPLSVMYLKVDDFEVIRGKYGSAIARQILDSAEPAMEKALRETDVLVRLEDGDFALMLPGKTRAESSLVAKRMRSFTSQCVMPPVDRELHFRFRHHIAELKTGETAQELLNRVRRQANSATTSRSAVDVS